MKLYCLLRFVFSVDLVFFKFATGVSARHTSRFLVWNVFHLLQRRTFQIGASGTNLIPALVIKPKTFSYLFILLIGNSVHLNLDAVSRKLKRKRKAHTKKKSAST